MFKIIIFCVLLINTQAKPTNQNGISEKPTLSEETTAQVDKIEEEYQKNAAVIGYIQNFKNVMTEYVTSQYKNLTINEIEKVKQIIEEFLTNFAKDLRDVVEKQHSGNAEEKYAEIEEEVVNSGDGLSDAQFNEIKNKIRMEFPQLSEESAQEIIVRLRNNLLSTRNKLDVIIRNSQQAQIEYA